VKIRNNCDTILMKRPPYAVMQLFVVVGAKLNKEAERGDQLKIGENIMYQIPLEGVVLLESTVNV